MRLAARFMSALLIATLVLPSLIAAPVAATSPTDHFVITGLAGSVTAGVPTSITVEAQDNSNATDSTFDGTVSVTVSGASAHANYTFTDPGDSGIHVFNDIVFETAGAQTVTITEIGFPSVTAFAGTTVDAAGLDHFVVAGYPTPAAAGVSHSITVTAEDQFTNTVTSYAGTVTFTSSDPLADLPAPSSLTLGTDTFSATLKTSGTQSIDVSDGPKIGGQGGITVDPAAATTLTLSAYPVSTTAGASHNVTVTAKDQFNNVAKGYAGLVTVTASGGTAHVSPSAATALTNGVGTYGVTFDSAGGGRSIDATGTLGVAPDLQSGITVVLGAATHIVLSGLTSNLASGTNRTLTATIEDAGGNTVTTDNTTVVSFDQSGGAGSVTGLATDMAANGVASIIVAGDLAGSVDITATASGLADSNVLTFTVVAGPASQIVLSGAVTNLASGANRTLTATIEDAAGNTRIGDNSTIVTFDQTTGTGSVTGLGTDQATGGVATITVTGSLAGSVTLDATGASMTSNALSFAVTVGAPASIVLSGLTTNLASGTDRDLTATIEDAGGNVVTTDNSTVVTFTKTAGGGTVTGLGADMASAGVATVTVTGDLAGSITFHATGASLTSNTLTFTVVAGPATQIVLSGAVTNLASGANRTLTATIEDAAGNTRIGDNSTVVTFSQTTGTGSLTGLGTDTAGAGIASLIVTGDNAGSVTLHATTLQPLTSNTLSFTVVAGPATQIVLSGLTTNLASGATRTFTATIEDAGGNVVTTDNSTIVSFDQTGGTGTVTGLGTDTASSGLASITVTGVLAGSVDITASASGLSDSNVRSFTVVAGPATQIVLSGAVTNLASGANRTLTATIEDAAGNTRIGDNSTVVTFSQTTGTGSLTGLGTDTAGAGIASLIVTGDNAGSVTLHATTLQPLTSNTLSFTVVAGPATQIVLSGLTTNLASGATRTFTATIEDAGGNVVTTDNSTIVSFDQTGGTGTVTGLGTDTASSGLASITVTGVLAGSVDITASASGLSDSNVRSFTVVAGPATQIVLSGATADLASGSTRVLTATIQDAAGNTRTSDTTSITFTKTSGTGTVTGLGSVPASGGIANKTVTGSLVGTVEITAVAFTDSNTLTFAVVPGPATQILLSGLATNLTSGATRLLTATIKDAAGNTRTGDSTIVTFSQTSGTGTVTGLGTAAASGGVATLTVTGELVGSVSLHATTTQPLTSNTLTFTVTVGAPSQLVLSGLATNLASGATRLLTATIEDAAGNTETGDGSTVVTFSQTSGTGTVTGLGTDTVSGGIANLTVTGNLVGSVTITATTTLPLTSNTLTFAVVPGPATQILLSGLATNLTSGATRLLTATIKDAAGNTRTGDSTIVTFSQTSGTGTVTGLGTAAASGGVATLTVTGELVGSVSLHATTTQPLTSNTLTFTVTVGAPSQLVLSGLATNLASGATRLLTATIEDAAGNTETGDGSTVVTFSQTSGTGTVTGLGTDTVSGGIANLTVTGNLVGSVTITATTTLPLTSNTLTFAVVPGPATQILLSGLATNLTSGATRLLTATIKDAAGNTRTGDSTIVTFSQTSGTGTVTGLGTAAASGGVATLTVTGELVGSVSLHATTTQPLTSNTLTFTVTVGAPSQLVLSGLATNLASGATRLLTATIEDAAGNTETGDGSTVVTFSQTSGTGTVTGLGTDTVSGGIANLTVTGNLVGSVTITATTTLPLTSNTLTFAVVPGPLDHLGLSPSTMTLSPNVDQLYTVTGFDAAGNSIGNVTAATTLSIDGGGTCSNVAHTCKAASAGDHTVTGTDSGKTGTATLTISSIAPSCPTPGSDSTLEDTVLNGTVPSCTDPNGDPLTYVLNVDAAHGHVTIDDPNTGDFTYTPDADYNGPDSFSWHASDGTNSSNVGSLSITVTAVNDAPSFTLGSDQTVLEDAGATTVTGFATGSAGPPNESSQTLTYVIDANSNTLLFASLPAINAAGDLTFTPAPNANGTATITVHVHDSGSNLLPNRNSSAAQQFDITVTAVNDAPTFSTLGDQTVLEDAGATTVTGFATGSAGPLNESSQTISYVIDNVSNPSLFSAGPAISPSGDLTYTSATDANGTATITVHILDSGSSVLPNVNVSPAQTFDINVTAVNDAPNFVTDGDQTVLEDAGATTVIAFATGNPGPTTAVDESGQTLTYVIDGDTNPGLFAVEPAISPAGDLTYTPTANASGSATITVHVVDSGPTGGNDVNFSATQTFNLSVTAVNDPPVAAADGPYLVKQGTSVTVTTANGVLTNDTDIDSIHTSLTAVVNVMPAHGALTLNADGSFTYTPTGVYLGGDSFTYHANDGSDNSNIATVSINVYLNHAPTAVGDIATVVAGSGYVALNLLANDNAVNPDPGETLRITHASHPVHGTVVITGGGMGLSYKPASGFIGSDVFNYTISDGVFSSSASVLVKVPKDTYEPVTTPPVQTIPSQSIGTSTALVRLTWSGTDRGFGIARYELWRSVNGNTYTKITLPSAGTRSIILTGLVGSTYRFRVRAIDKKGNVGAFTYGPAFKINRYQENGATYTGAWALMTGTAYSAGHDRATTNAGVSATLATTGRSFAWVAVKGSIRGTADVYVDGVLQKHVTLTASSTTYRYVVWSITFGSVAFHTIRIVNTGPTTKRLDVDAFVVLR